MKNLVLNYDYVNKCDNWKKLKVCVGYLLSLKFINSYLLKLQVLYNLKQNFMINYLI